MNNVFQDWTANRRNPKGRIVLALFRAANMIQRKRGPLWALPRLIVGASYRLLVEWGLGIELPWKLQVGPRARLFHGQALVINDAVTIGADVTLRHSTTIGHASEGGLAPTIGDGVDIGSNCVIIGDVTVGDHARIGAGAVVTRSVAAGDTVVGNPARSLHQHGNWQMTER